MPCLHKFSDDLQLRYVNWEFKTLIIGTFNPAWKSCKNNNSQWFYGRTDRNEFWCILPTIHGEESLLNDAREEWIDFCKRHQLAITDIIHCINDADEFNLAHQNIICKFKDEDLINFQSTLNNIPTLLETYKSIEQIVITRQDLPLFWRNAFRNTFLWIQQHPERNIKIRMLRSPSREARRGVIGNFCNFIAARWIERGYAII